MKFSTPEFPVMCGDGFGTLVCYGIVLQGISWRYYDDNESWECCSIINFNAKKGTRVQNREGSLRPRNAKT